MKSLLMFATLTISSMSFANSDASLLVQELGREADICIEQDSTTYGMRICLSNQSEQLDGLLNKTYKELKSKLSREAKKRLVQSQRDWLKYRKSNCEMEASSVIGGTAETVIIMDCDNQMTEKKILQLEKISNTPL